MRAGGTAAGEAWGVGRVSVVPGLELPPRFLGSQVRVCLALSPCLRVDGLSVGVPLGPRVPSALVCLALSPCLRVDGLSVCGCPFGSGFVHVGLSLFLHPPAAWLSALSHLCSSVRLGFLLAETVS